MPDKTVASHPRIGIMADSHGDHASIGDGAVYLNRRGCDRIYHLGDICDTNLPQTADRCVSAVKRHGILAVKGNNDHSLAADARGRIDGRLSRATILFLETLPLSLAVRGATLVHSQPFVREFGLSAMIGMIGKPEAERYFRRHPNGLLLRGHSHRPEVIRQTGGLIRFDPLDPGTIVALESHRPCIVTCGALTERLVMIWDIRANHLECCRLD